MIEIEKRVLKVCSAFDKITADKVCKSHFIISDTCAALQCQATVDY
jgi:HD-GYP domain-containing protein (c-di-GMP phosphodiesterase class II)